MKNIKKLEKKLNINLKNKTLLIESLTHKSSNLVRNNEKLEFLGDRVIGLVLAKKLFELYPDENEGVLDKRFAKLVNRKACCYVAWSIGMQNYIILGDSNKKISLRDEKILSDSCEALIGAIYLDQGYSFVEKFILNIWKNHLSTSNITILDSKTKLQEYALKRFKKLPIYKFISSKGPKHKPTFKISVSIQGSKLFIGSGKSKQEAEQDGASKLLESVNIN